MIMTIVDQIRDEKLQYDINREAEKLLALSSHKINKYEYRTGEKILSSNQKQITKEAKPTYSLLGEAFKKQIKTIEDQGEKQVDALKNLPVKDNKYDNNEKLLKYKEIFDKFSNEIIGELYSISKQIDFNNLIYYLKDKNISPINFVCFRSPMYIYNDIKSGNISIEK